MTKTKSFDRIVFLAEQFDVFEIEDGAKEISLEIKITELKSLGYDYVNPIFSNDSNIIALISNKNNDKKRILTKVSIESKIFSDIITSDPTENKIYIQWMLEVFTKLLKSNNINKAIMFVCEDLPQAKTYLTLFDENKRKKKFKELCLNSPLLSGIKDYSNINQYKNLSELFDAVDPFVEKESTDIENVIQKYVKANQAIIPVKDRNFTVYIPFTRDASTIFDGFANWCTAKNENGMFSNYTKKYKKPNGSDSNLYIIINNNFFNGESDEIYQIHFETSQIKDRKNNGNINFFEAVLNKSEIINKYFYEELIKLAKSNITGVNNSGVNNNLYLDFLIQFGHSEALFDILPLETPIIKIMNRTMPKIPDISRFKELDSLIITNAKLTEIHPSIGDLEKLELLALTDNNLKKIPNEISNLKNLRFINIVGNPISEIPDTISELDSSNGGSLYRIAVKESEIGPENFKKLKKLLPNTQIS